MREVAPGYVGVEERQQAQPKLVEKTTYTDGFLDQLGWVAPTD